MDPPREEEEDRPRRAIDERSEQQFRRESHHFEVELFSRMSFLLPRTLCVSVSFYTTFLPFIELVGRSDFYISVTSITAILPRNRVTSVESSRRATLYVFVYVAQREVNLFSSYHRVSRGNVYVEIYSRDV